MAVNRDISDRRRAEDAVRKTDAELLAAAEIQARLLPDKAPELPGFDIAGHCYSAKAAAGDHFDFLLRPDGSLLVVLDSSGAEKARLESGSLPFALISELPFTLPDPLPLAAGNLIFLYTDGLTEAHRIKGPLLGLERVLETVRHHQAQPAAEIVTAVRDAACRHLGADKPKDDITLVVIKVLA